MALPRSEMQELVKRRDNAIILYALNFLYAGWSSYCLPGKYVFIVDAAALGKQSDNDIHASFANRYMMT